MRDCRHCLLTRCCFLSLLWQVLSELDVVPSLLGSDFSYLFLQEFQGHITLVPNATLRDFLRIICDPTLDDVKRMMREGRLTTWRKMSMVRNRLLTGHKLNECIRKMAELLVDSEGGDGTHEHEHGDMPSRVHPIARSRRLIQEQDLYFSQL